MRISIVLVVSLLVLTGCSSGEADDALRHGAGGKADDVNDDGGAGDDGGTTALCGNGVLDPGEQCDDGNTTNLDGCDSSCQFEQMQRVNSLTMEWTPSTLCPANALGGAIKSAAQGTFTSKVNDAVKSGQISIAFDFIGLPDLSGQNASAVVLGGLLGTPVMGTGYDGTSDLDWWYTTDPMSIDANRHPTATLNGSIANRALTAGPGHLTISLSLGGDATRLSLSQVRLVATVGPTSAPLLGVSPRGHLASEHLDPSLRSFETLTGGELCANVSAASLAGAPVPATLVQGGSTACSEGYTNSNTLLDVIVGGCHVFFITAIGAAQPDAIDASVAPAGAGGPYQFVTNSTHAVSGCKDHTGASVALPDCLAAAAYSSAFHFTTDRVILK